MHRGRNARLDRMSRRAGDGDCTAVERRRLLLARAAIGAAIRSSLERQGIDPARAAALRVADEASAELAASGGLPSQPCAERPSGNHSRSDDPGSPDGSASGFDGRIDRLVARYRGGLPTEPDLARASLAELFAWCIAAADDTDST